MILNPSLSIISGTTTPRIAISLKYTFLVFMIFIIKCIHQCATHPRVSIGPITVPYNKPSIVRFRDICLQLLSFAVSCSLESPRVCSAVVGPASSHKSVSEQWPFSIARNTQASAHCCGYTSLVSKKVASGCNLAIWQWKFATCHLPPAPCQGE